MLAHSFPGDRSPDAWPAGAGIEFCVGGKQWRAAADAHVDAARLLVPVGPAEGAFSAVLTDNVELFGRELRPPLGIGLADFGGYMVGRHHLALLADRTGHYRGRSAKYTIHIYSMGDDSSGSSAVIGAEHVGLGGRANLTFDLQNILTNPKDLLVEKRNLFLPLAKFESKPANKSGLEIQLRRVGQSADPMSVPKYLSLQPADLQNSRGLEQ
jgi:hypothetical protein